MSMFDNYDKLSPNYIPNNSSSETNNEYLSIEQTLPRVVYNIKNNPIGLSWTYGERFELKFSAAKTIKVAENSLIYDISGAGPTNTTKGISSQQAYNTVDCKSWTCAGISGGFYIWVEDAEVEYLASGTKEITLIPDMQGKILELEIFNFRWDTIYNCKTEGKVEIALPVDDTIDNVLKPGTYYCIIKLKDETRTMIQDKTMLIVR